MPKSKTQKIAIVEQLGEAAKGASAMVFADFTGLKTKDMNELRKTAKSLGGNVRIVKKTLAQRGLKDVVPEEVLARPGGIAAIWFKAEDVLSALKSVWQFSKAKEALNILGGYAPDFGGMMAAERVIALAKLPSREGLLAQLVGMLNWPVAGLVRVLDAASKRSK